MHPSKICVLSEQLVHAAITQVLCVFRQINDRIFFKRKDSERDVLTPKYLLLV